MDESRPAITADELDHARSIFEIFKCQDMGDYHDLYLTLDTLILASVMEEFREVCFKTYGLDCVQFYTASNLSGAAFMKVCETPIELLTDREHLDLVEKLIRGGVASVYSKRLCIANNKDLINYDASKPSTYITMLDAKNLYGGIMKHYRLPVSGYQLCSVKIIDKVLKTSSESDIGYVVEVDLHYPLACHDDHMDFHLAPEKRKVDVEWLSEYQVSLSAAMNWKPGKTPKLMQTLCSK